jgi:hypothetical protein
VGNKGQQIAMQTAQETTSQRRRPGNPNWRKGVSGNPEGSRLVIERRAALVANIERDLERDVGALTATDRVLIGRAADLLLARPRSHTERVRSTNTATRIIERIRERRHDKQQPTDWLVTLNAPDSARDGMCASATPLAGEQNGRTGARPCASGEPFESEGDEGDAS